MKRVTVESVDSATFGDGVERRCLGRELASTDVAINHYGVPSGERLAGLHAHDDQEELFVVLEGRVVFETLGRRVEAAAGEAARFPPGEFQSCTNPDGAGGEAVVLALGAPRDSDDVRVPVCCPGCDRDEQRPVLEDGEERLACPGCGAERKPACPDCGGADLRVVLGDGGPVERCRECGTTTPAR